ncbi:MAG: hypothetical protein CM15mP59_0390 [Flavobacteriaceae bacterium]|nr:MAG: hypothetical protein CM15mP59_0390 [Flavobacteriaceae bacterium]
MIHITHRRYSFLINLTDSYNMFNLGREIYINLKGYTLGSIVQEMELFLLARLMWVKIV